MYNKYICTQQTHVINTYMYTRNADPIAASCISYGPSTHLGSSS